MLHEFMPERQRSTQTTEFALCVCLCVSERKVHLDNDVFRSIRFPMCFISVSNTVSTLALSFYFLACSQREGGGEGGRAEEGIRPDEDFREALCVR